MVRVITISREYGSGGESIAHMIGERLGWKVVDNHLIAELANTAKVNPDLCHRLDECVDSWFDRLTKSLWHGGYEGGATRSEAVFDAEAMARLWHSTIEEAAKIGNCVTVGRGGQCILHRRKDVFHVAVYAPLHERIERMRDRMPKGVDPKAYVQEMDQLRADYIRHYFDHDWMNRHLYHLNICSSIGLERAADAILCAAGLPTDPARRDG